MTSIYRSSDLSVTSMQWASLETISVSNMASVALPLCFIGVYLVKNRHSTIEITRTPKFMAPYPVQKSRMKSASDFAALCGLSIAILGKSMNSTWSLLTECAWLASLAFYSKTGPCKLLLNASSNVPHLLDPKQKKEVVQYLKRLLEHKQRTVKNSRSIFRKDYNIILLNKEFKSRLRAFGSSRKKSRHSKRLLHQKFKESNILLDMELQPLLRDFGMSRVKTHHLAKDVREASGFMAPKFSNMCRMTAETKFTHLIFPEFNRKRALNMDRGILGKHKSPLLLHNIKSHLHTPHHLPISTDTSKCGFQQDLESINERIPENSSSKLSAKSSFQTNLGTPISGLPATPKLKVPGFFSAGGGDDKEKGYYEIIKEENIDDPDTFLLKFILVSSCIMLCFLSVFSENNGTTIAGVGNIFLRSSWIFYAFTGCLVFAAPTSLLSLETVALNPKLATRSGKLAVISMLTALALLLLSTVSLLCKIIM